MNHKLEKKSNTYILTWKKKHLRTIYRLPSKKQHGHFSVKDTTA